MSTLYQGLSILPKSSGSDIDRIWRLFSSKLGRVVVAAVFALCIALLWLREYGTSYLLKTHGIALPADYRESSTLQDATKTASKGRLHLLVPATSSNENLCKLMLSAQILGYPTPVLINYGDHEAKDAYKQHLTKVDGILNYLDNLETSDEWDEDLVLVIDGYDIWFQLRPDVLIKRFYEVNAAADARVRERFGEDVAREHDMRQTVIFGPDKLCWPVDFSRPACWAVPDATLPDNAYGPPPITHEDRDKNPAKWLNSGTVLGSAQDMREIFRATQWAIERNHTTDSDQFYFAEVWGQQEYARLQKRPDLLEQQKKKLMIDHEDKWNGSQVRFEPSPSGNRTEYHIGIDYDSTMFQTIAFWKQHLSWSRAIDSWTPPNPNKVSPVQPYTIRLPEDIQQSAPPFGALTSGLGLANQAQWKDVELAYNSLTNQHPVVVHVTGNAYEKNFRQFMWYKIWFQSRGEELRQAAYDQDSLLISNDPIGGLMWYNAEGGDDAIEIDHKGKGGAWTDRRGWVNWRRLCSKHEENLYDGPEEDYYHRDWQSELVRIVEVNGSEPEYPVLRYYHTAADMVGAPGYTATYWPTETIRPVAETTSTVVETTATATGEAEGPLGKWTIVSVDKPGSQIEVAQPPRFPAGAKKPELHEEEEATVPARSVYTPEAP